MSRAVRRVVALLVVALAAFSKRGGFLAVSFPRLGFLQALALLQATEAG
jgi:hypothetical protein